MERLDDNAINIYTDGSSKQKPRRGGYAFVYVTVDREGNEVVDERSPDGSLGSNNQEMELKAVVEALKLLRTARSPVALNRFDRIAIFTDSAYVHDHVSTAMHQWSRRQWTRSGGAPVLNADLWHELLRQMRLVGKPVDFKWIRNKSSPFAKRVDKLAKASADRPLARPPMFRGVRKKLTEESVDPGVVPVEGQAVDIRIVVSEYLRRQRTWRFKYEVMSEGPLQGKVDFVFGDRPLLQRNTYTVRLNDDPDFPKIVEVVETWPTASYLGRRSGSES
jgi:ribonuclease HI